MVLGLCQLKRMSVPEGARRTDDVRRARSLPEHNCSHLADAAGSSNEKMQYKTGT
jgi:hypothetical protein